MKWYIELNVRLKLAGGEILNSGKNCIAFGITQDMAFAVANIILSIEKKSPNLVDNYVIFYESDSPIKASEQKILSCISDKIIFRHLDFKLKKNAGTENFFKKYTQLCFAKFKLFDLAKEYDNHAPLLPCIGRTACNVQPLR